MARQRSPDRDKAFEMWKESSGKMKLKDIATALGLQDSQIRKWKNQDKWDDQLKSNVTKSKSNVTNKSGAPKGNKNAVGNSGGGAPRGNQNAVGHGAPYRNDNAAIHGFFRRYFPDDDETHQIIDDILTKGPIDILWENIVIKYTAIIRAQKIMFVRDHHDMTKELKKSKVEYETEPGCKDEELRQYETFREEEFEIQFAWDKHATFLNAQARAMSELRGLIKDFLTLSGEDDTRRLQLEKMQQDIRIQNEKIAMEKERFEMEKKQSSGNNEADDWADAVKAIAERRRKLKGEGHEQ